MTQKIIRIAAIQGGATRAIIPLKALQFITAQTQQNFNELFDLASGCSSGGLLCAGLSNGYYNKQPLNPTSLEALYLQYASHVFSKKSDGEPRTVAEQLAAAKNIYEILAMLLGKTTLATSRIPLLIPSYCIHSQQPKFFSSWDTTPENDFYLHDLVMTTISSYGDFPAHKLVNTKGVVDGLYIDPAICYTNQPALDAYAAAKKHFPNAKYIIASFDTGYTRPFKDDQDAWEHIQQNDVFHYLNSHSIPRTATLKHHDIVLREISSAADSDIVYYERFTTAITQAEAKGSFTSDEGMLANYQQIGERLLAENKDKLLQLCEALMAV